MRVSLDFNCMARENLGVGQRFFSVLTQFCI